MVIAQHFQEPLKKIANHRVLAINRGEKDGFLTAKISIEDGICIDYLKSQTVTSKSDCSEKVALACDDAFKRLIFPSVENEIRNMLTERAGDAAIKVFSKNLSGLLLQPPIRGEQFWDLTLDTEPGAKLP